MGDVMQKETEKFLKEREENDQKIDDLKSKNSELTIKMCEIEGNCPHCFNWHYPHC